MAWSGGGLYALAGTARSMSVTGGWLNILIALAAACLLGIGFVCQQHAAYQEPLEEMLHVKLILRLIREPVWLLGIAAMIAGQVFGALAFNRSQVSEVEPLLAMTLVFALTFAHLIYREHFSLAEWCGAVLVCAGISVFLLFGSPEGGEPVANYSFRWAAAGVVVGVAAILVVIGLRCELATRAMLLASAAGMLYGVQDVLTRGSLLIKDRGLGALLGTWQPYALVAVGATGLLLTQSAFDAAPLRVSLPATTAAEPIIGILLAVVIFAERLTLTPAAIAAQVLGIAAMVAGIVILGRSPMLTEPQGRSLTRPEANFQ